MIITSLSSVKLPHNVTLMVEGNVGAGKSTFLRILGSILPEVHVNYEPLAEWQNVGGENLFEQYYQNRLRWAYTFQTYVLLTRIRLQERIAHNSAPIEVFERSVYSDRYCFTQACFELGVIKPLEWQLYKEWFSWLVGQYLRLPDAFIYLRTDPKVSYERLLKRNRSGEGGISLEYIELLNQKHEDWLIEKKDILPQLRAVPVLVLACDEDFEHNKYVQEALVKRLMEFLAVHFNVSASGNNLSTNISKG